MNYLEETIREDRKYAGNIIEVYSTTVTLPNGKEASRDIVRHPGGSVVLAMTAKGNLLLVEQFRKPFDEVSLELPAGKLDAGEAHELCARRELKEETGYIAGKLRRAMVIHTTPGFTNEVLHLYVATELTEEAACPDEDEFISCREYSIAECIEMVEKGEITDAKTIIGIYLADRIQKGEHIFR